MNGLQSKRPITVAFATILFLLALNVQAQRASERYIPIGQSPGMSKSYTYTGKIRAVDTKVHALEVREEGTRYSVLITPTTQIWLDRSKYRRENLKGAFSDCRKGRRVEIKFTDASKDKAEWVKIESK